MRGADGVNLVSKTRETEVRKQGAYIEVLAAWSARSGRRGG